MKEVKIISDIDNFNDNSFLKLKVFFDLILKLIIDLKYVLIVFFLFNIIPKIYFRLQKSYKV